MIYDSHNGESMCEDGNQDIDYPMEDINPDDMPPIVGNSSSSFKIATQMPRQLLWKMVL